MHHKTDVRFVDPHPEGYRSHHDLQVVALEFLLYVGADMIFQAGVIGRRADAATLQACGGILHFRSAIAVDNA